MIQREHLNYANDKVEDYGILNYHVLEGMADWVRVVDKDGIIIYANKAMKDSLGENILGMKCHKSYGKDTKCNFCITFRSIETGEVVQKEDIINGRYYSIKASPVTNSKGEIYAAVEVFRDVTRERKLELELIEKNKRLVKDLQFARKIQERILPQKGLIDDLNISYIYKASEMLSGDMFDIFYVNEDNIGFYISDVSGHGIAASMMTMFIRQTMRAIKDDILSPAVVLTELHRRFLLLNLEEDKYFTIFYGVYNKVTHQFKYANAGHNCIPIRYNDKGLDFLKTTGFPIAKLFSEMKYDEKKIQLQQGDKILFYTDGITEAKDETGKEFGEEGVIQIIKDKPDNVLEEIEKNVINHNWEYQEDDYALVLMEVIRQ